MSKQPSPEQPKPADPQLGAAVYNVLKPVLVLLTAATLYSAFHAVQQYFSGRHVLCSTPLPLSHLLADDCLRLGVVWPALNLLLSVIPPAGLLLALTTKRSRRDALSFFLADEISAPTPKSTDTATNFRTIIVAVSLAAAVSALAFIHMFVSAPRAGVHGYHLMYWRSNMAFWQVLSLTCSYDLLDYVAGTSDTCKPNSPAVHWSVVVAIILQLVLCAPVEGLFTFAISASEPILLSIHSRFVLVSALPAIVAMYFAVRSCLARLCITIKY